jgi:hypothetical protein
MLISCRNICICRTENVGTPVNNFLPLATGDAMAVITPFVTTEMAKYFFQNFSIQFNVENKFSTKISPGLM